MKSMGIDWSGFGRSLKPGQLLSDPVANSVLDAEATRLLDEASAGSGRTEADEVAERRADRRQMLREILEVYPTIRDLQSVVDRYGLGARMQVTVSVPIMLVAWAILRSGVSSPAAAVAWAVEKAASINE